MLGEGNQLKIRILDDFSHVNSEFPNDVKYSPISILTNSQLHSQEPKCHSKLMNASPQDRADNLDKTIDDYALNVVCPSLNISFDELSDPSLISTDYKPSIIVGRIAISSSKNEITQSHDPIVLKNTFIESSRRLGKGCCVRLDVSQCSSHMYLFSGQIVALRGRNVDGSCFQVLDQLYFQPKLNYTGVPNFKIIVASGPFGAIRKDKTTDWGALERLFYHAIVEKIQLLILFGPFMPEKHGWMENEEIPTPSHEFQSMYRRFTDSLLPHAHGLKIVMVPSVRDKISDPILPLNPLPQVNQKCSHSIIMASNPDVLYIGSENDPMIIAISSDDIYLPIGLVAFDDPFPSSASKALKTQSESHGNIESLQIDGDNFNQKISGKNLIKNRFEKLATSIISQESLNPLEPSPTPIDYSVSPEKIHYGAAILKTIIERGGQGGSIASFGDDQKDKTYRFSNVAPHIVITSGTLSPFAFETDSKSLFVNSSHIMRSKTSHIESWVTIEVCSDNGNVRSSARVYQSSI